MISISKGDIFIEPLELLIELLVRVFAKGLFRGLPSEPIDQWGWIEWLWLLLVLLLVSVIAWAVWRSLGSKRA